MWLRRNTDWPSLLTLGNATHISDSRYSVSFQYPNNWRLAISGVRREDRGLYVCQVNTHPPRMLITNVTVLGNIVCFCENESKAAVESRIILSDVLLRDIGVQCAQQMRVSFLHLRIRECRSWIVGCRGAYPNETVVANLNSIPVKIQLPWENLVASRPETSQLQLYHVAQLVASAMPRVYFILLSDSHRQTRPHIPISLRAHLPRDETSGLGNFPALIAKYLYRV